MSETGLTLEKIEVRDTRLMQLIALSSVMLMCFFIVLMFFDLFVVATFQDSGLLFTELHSEEVTLSEEVNPFSREDLLILFSLLGGILGSFMILFLKKWGAWLWLFSFIVVGVIDLLSPAFMTSSGYEGLTFFGAVLIEVGGAIEYFHFFAFVGNIRWR